MLDVTASAKPAAPKTVTTKHLAYALAEQHQLSKKQSLEMLEDLIGMITKHLKKGERVKIAGLGILQVRNRAARMGRNPMTGEPIQIKASKKVAFRATKELEDGDLIAMRALFLSWLASIRFAPRRAHDGRPNERKNRGAPREARSSRSGNCGDPQTVRTKEAE